MRSPLFWQRVISLLPVLNILYSQNIFAYAAPLNQTDMVYDFEDITPSPSLKWIPCFGNFTCARLEVPLDYKNASIGTTAIAFVKYPAAENPDCAENIILNDGGPGGSGVGFVLEDFLELQELVGAQYNLVGMDPRGINNSGPFIDCFLNNTAARWAWQRNFFPEVSNASSTATAAQYYSSELFGQWCSEAIRNQGGAGQYVSTPAVAQDMLSYARAEQKAAGKKDKDARLLYYGVSYGTVLGVTFASLFPDNVGRLILDGVLDAEDYYNNGWKANLFDADQAVGNFSLSCYQSGAANCSFWGPSPQNITDRLDSILDYLKDNPIPVSGLRPGSTPGLATYSDLKQALLQALYVPLAGFPALADTLSSLEKGDGSMIVNAWNWTLGPDINTLIKCVDAYAKNNFSELQDYENYVTLLEGQSKYFGEVWPNNADGVLCRSFDLDIPHGSFPGPLPPSSNHTAYPILFVSAAIDPVTPIRGARKMSNAFPGSVLLTQDSVGHTASASASTCLVGYIQAYLDGQVPAANIICESDRVPFRDPGTTGF